MHSPTTSSDTSSNEHRSDFLNALRKENQEAIIQAAEELSWKSMLTTMADYQDNGDSPILIAIGRQDPEIIKVLNDRAVKCFNKIKKLPSRYTEACHNAITALVDQTQKNFEKEKSWYQSEESFAAQKEQAIKLLYETKKLTDKIGDNDKNNEEHIKNFFDNSKQLIRSDTLQKCFWSVVIILTATFVLGASSLFIAAAIKGGALTQFTATLSTSSFSSITFAQLKAELIIGLSVGLASGVIAGAICGYGLFKTNHKINEAGKQMLKPEIVIPKPNDFD